MALGKALAVMIASTAFWLAPSVASANLVSNGDFSEWGGDKPAGWEPVEAGQKVAKDAPEGRPSALRVEVVKEVGGTLGEVRQTIRVRKEQRYRLSAEVRSTRAGQAFLMVKLRDGRKEGERLSTTLSTEQWATLTKEFDSGAADNVQILCRYSQKADAVGATHWFTNVTLVALDAAGNPMAESAPSPRPAAPRKKPAPPIPSPVAAPGVDQYVLPKAAGDGSGKDWANARGAASLQAAVDAAGSGNTVYLGSGTYEKVSLQVHAGGSGPAALKTLAGKDTGGGLPLFRSDFDRMNPARSGGVLLSVAPGISHLVIRDLQVEAYRTAVQLQGRHRNIRIENVDVTNSRDAFWLDGGAEPGQPESGSRDLVLKDCDVRNFTKRAVRILNGNIGVQVMNCRADAGGKEWAAEVFPVCFHVLGGKGGVVDREITFTDCVAANAYYDAGDKYWNADGFCAESATSDLTWTRCLAYGNTDGGWDIKGARPRFVDCIGIDNKRNFRLWASTREASMTNCLAAFSHDRGKNAHDMSIWLGEGIHLRAERCTIYGDRRGLVVENNHGESARSSVILDRCLLAAAPGGEPLVLTPATTLEKKQSEVGGMGPLKLKAPRPDWRGGDDAFDPVGLPDTGYRCPKRGE